MNMPENMQVSPAMENPSVYPEVYYKMQPYIMMACDHMDAYGPEMPSQEMVEGMSDAIYDDMMRTYPEMADYMRSQEQGGAARTSLAVQGPFGFMSPFGFRRDFRRRGLGRDLIDILLLSELFRRRRRPFRDRFFDFDFDRF